MTFATIPEAIPAPGAGEAVGLDRGVAVSVALSTGEMLPSRLGLVLHDSAGCAPSQPQADASQPWLESSRPVKLAIAKLRACDVDARRDWAEKTSTDLARRFDVIRVEDLNIRDMTRSAKGTGAKEPGQNMHAKAGLNREIMRSGWGLLVRRLEN